MPSLLCVNSPIGPLTLREENGALISVERVYTPSGGDKTELLCTAAQQLTEYFSGARQAFDLPLSPAGTAFQQAVWR